ncbi:type II toxin-antitoxin system VapC family toxin [Dyadobacter crusticola]|uniref:type II toxin-antitoxin system VapC family toxin n=1 Tax=Dyadobacter crusticola TaxID=292407 RepID=UPI0004E25171|nr:PIN domain-containing protein [Dyadobacter crusticola]
MEKVFVDTDVCIDLLSGRKPFNSFAERIFTLAEQGKIEICISALSISNIHYVLHAQYGVKEPTLLIARFRTLVTILSVNSKVIDRAIASGFANFEDAIQYNTAIENSIHVLITKNLKDYKLAEIRIVTPEAYLAFL